MVTKTKLEWGNISLNEEPLKTSRVNMLYPFQDSDSSLKLNLFCDASPQAYRFIFYGVNNKKLQIIFSEVKLATMKQQTLSTMELLQYILLSNH